MPLRGRSRTVPNWVKLFMRMTVSNIIVMTRAISLLKSKCRMVPLLTTLKRGIASWGSSNGRTSCLGRSWISTEMVCATWGSIISSWSHIFLCRGCTRNCLRNLEKQLRRYRKMILGNFLRILNLVVFRVVYLRRWCLSRG